ncbi:Uncharacterized protein APZ42_000493 [Daphnia magna]|uniref:Uncharacterized protein n=1 Tax=Daphnia magna TaxID=35525 RepID=A0A164JLI4_9CRUS|nr:Uncharacterized protein APZ42_000493 [Daphnia magna]
MGKLSGSNASSSPASLSVSISSVANNSSSSAKSSFTMPDSSASTSFCFLWYEEKYPPLFLGRPLFFGAVGRWRAAHG